MKVLDKITVRLNNGQKDVNVLLYLKEVMVRNKHKTIKAFCRIMDN